MDYIFPSTHNRHIELLMDRFPDNIQRLIYAFDETYHDKWKQCAQAIPWCVDTDKDTPIAENDPIVF